MINYIPRLGIPYMGSKRKISFDIVDHIIKYNPNVKYIYDLFGGGGAISFEAIQRRKIEKVYYNEYNQSIVNLLLHIRDKGFTNDFYEWIDRDTFKKYKYGTCWKAGLIKTCWSFGNNYEKGYLFSEENEKIKKPLHELIVNEDLKQLPIIKEMLGIDIPEKLLGFKISISQRRLNVMEFVKKKCERIDLQQLERLQQLEQLERLQQLEQLEITNLSYEDVEINTPIDETIIYLDPPYENTAKYEKCVDHRKLEQYIEQSKFKIYVSSYDFNLPVVKEITHRSTLSQKANNEVVEKLFCNRPNNNEIYVNDKFEQMTLF